MRFIESHIIVERGKQIDKAMGYFQELRPIVEWIIVGIIANHRQPRNN